MNELPKDIKAIWDDSKAKESMNTRMTITVEVSPQMYKYDDLTFHAAIKEVIANFEDVDPRKLTEILHYEAHNLDPMMNIQIRPPILGDME